MSVILKTNQKKLRFLGYLFKETKGNMLEMVTDAFIKKKTNVFVENYRQKLKKGVKFPQTVTRKRICYCTPLNRQQFFYVSNF